MKVTSLTPSPSERETFSLSSVYCVPQSPGCYVLTAHNGTVLYVGQSIDISKRMEEHLNDLEKIKDTPYGKVFWFYYLLCDANQLDSTERGWYYEHKQKEGKKPFFNKVSPPT